MKRIICLDFDGVLHSYVRPFSSYDFDAPTPGAIDFLIEVVDWSEFEVAIFSSRSSSYEGIDRMIKWLKMHINFYYVKKLDNAEIAAKCTDDMMRRISFPQTKPKAFVTIDDRAITFTGKWPSMEEISSFKPWNWREQQDFRAAEAKRARAERDRIDQKK